MASDDRVLNFVGHQTLTVSTTVVTLTMPTGLLPTKALIYVGGADIRFRADGTDPTATSGMHVGADDYIDLTEGNNAGILRGIELIREDASDATLAISYFA